MKEDKILLKILYLTKKIDQINLKNIKFYQIGKNLSYCLMKKIQLLTKRLYIKVCMIKAM